MSTISCASCTEVVAEKKLGFANNIPVEIGHANKFPV